MANVQRYAGPNDLDMNMRDTEMILPWQAEEKTIDFPWYWKWYEDV